VKKPIIGIVSTCAFFPTAKYGNVDKVYVNQSYVQAVANNGGVPLIIPPSLDEDEENIKVLLGLCSGLLFPGGEDVDPAFYNEEPDAKLGVFRPEIDKFSFFCAEYALNCNMPVFGICKGMQLLNVAKGGSLYQDMSLRNEPSILHSQSYSPSYLAHSVEISPGSILEKILGGGKIRVNTMHHQAVKDLGEGLTASAFAPDGIMEAFENEEGSIVAVQWHPEELTLSAPGMNKLFRYFIGRAGEYISG